MKLIIFEDKKTNLLFPFCENHASFEIKIGLYTNLERILFTHKDNDGVLLIVRKEIEKIIKHKYPEYEVNPAIVPKGKCFNGRSIYQDGEKGFQYIKDNISLEKFHKQLSKVQDKENNNCSQINFLWDLFKYNDRFFSSDINTYKFDAISSFPSITKLFETIKKKYELASLINEKDIIIHEDTELKAGVIIDATESPVIIGKNVVIDIGALIQGPVFIDDNSYIAPGAKIRAGTFIGKHCKVGGEVSCSVISDFSNKVHDGFLGHSFIGEWVNIGAGTNSSNLKNNYSKVRIDLGEGLIDTQRIFLGALIGDFSRLGISTMLNTGTYIGLGCNVFGGGFQKKYFSSFSWGDNEVVNFDKFINTCKIMENRRGVELSKTEIFFLKKLYDKNN